MVGEKKMYKTKTGASIVGVAAILDLFFDGGIHTALIIAEIIGVVVLGYGIRDWPLIND